MKDLLYTLLFVFLITSCTEDEGVKFQPDSFYINTESTVVNEADGTIELTFNTSKIYTSDLIINYTLTGTAENTIDYTLLPIASVTIPTGELSTVLTINLINDSLIEEQEDIILTVTDTSNPELFIDASDAITISIIDDEGIAFQNGILIPNFGNAASGTISFISNNFTTTQQQIYNSVNSENVGNGLMSIGFNNDKAYLITTDDNKITVVNRYSFLKETTINTGLNNPRHFVVSGDKGYVTNWGDPTITTDDFIAVIDLATNTVETTIPVEEGPERVITLNGKLYVSHKGGLNYNNIISVIDTTDNTVATLIGIGDVPDEMIFDASNNIWVVCEGKPAASGSETGGKLIKINTSDDEVVTSIDFASTEHPKNLSYETGKLYYDLAGGIYSMLETDITLPTTPIITTPTFAMSVKNGNLYTTNAVDMISNGTLKVFDLTDNSEIQSITVGVIPRDIYFN
ncbi:MAG: hypothetical protein COA88_15265 [Kordia sp.]|nr:MAG: hypothetical protein COA88_15265 [Kordia sp.]